jgi:hypothetical protein
MTAPWFEPALSLLFTLGVGGPILGLLGLLRPSEARKRTRQTILLTLGLLAVGFSAAAAVLGQPPLLWAPPAALVGVCGLFWGLRDSHVQAFLARLGAPLRWPRLQAACLLGAGPVLAVWWSLQAADADTHYITEEDVSAPEMSARNFEPVTPTPVHTDKGREIKLLRRTNPTERDQEFRVRQSRLLRRIQLTERVIALADGPPLSNCHGWVFTGGAYWLASGEVAAILQDNGYRPVLQPQRGDVAVYRQEEEIIHTGVVRAAGDGGPVLVESKWGDLGVFIHLPDEHPYGDGRPTYYRSSRAGHLLRGLSGSSPQDSPVPALASCDDVAAAAEPDEDDEVTR